MTESEGAHADQAPSSVSSVIPQIELENAVGSREGPVPSARQDLPAQPRAIEGASVIAAMTRVP